MYNPLQYAAVCNLMKMEQADRTNASKELTEKIDTADQFACMIDGHNGINDW